MSDIVNRARNEKPFLTVPIGTTVDRKQVINFSLGAGVYSAFITGMAGTGKTTLLNNIILGIAKQYTSEEICLYLIDYMSGIEFHVFKENIIR